MNNYVRLGNTELTIDNGLTYRNQSIYLATVNFSIHDSGMVMVKTRLFYCKNGERGYMFVGRLLVSYEDAKSIQANIRQFVFDFAKETENEMYS